MLHFIITAPLLKKYKSRWENEASFLKLFQILSAHEVTDNYGNSALIGLMVYHWAETGTKTCVRRDGDCILRLPAPVLWN